jgi:ABC-type transporter Mla subunit MlaD
VPDARSNEANVRAGIAVIGAITAGAALLWAGMAWNDSRTLDYVVWFTPEEGVYGIREGSVVRVGGLTMGRVRKVAAHFAAGEIAAYDVQIAIRSDIRLYRGVRIEAAADPVSGDGAIEISALGDFPMAGSPHAMGDGESPEPLPEGTRIKSTPAPAYRTFVGTKGSRHLRTLIDQIPALKEQYAQIGDDLPERVKALRSAFDALTAAARTDWDDWRRDFDVARDAAESAIAKLGAGADPAPDSVMPQLRAVRDALPAAGKSERMRAEFTAGTLRSAIRTVDALRAHGKDFAAALDHAEHGLQKGLADFSIASQELAATGSEALLSPWRLLASPDAAQRTREARLGEARVYAEAAVDFDRAMAAVRQSLVRDAALLERTPALAQLLRTQVDAATRTFEDHTRRFMDMLIGAPAAGSRPGQLPVAPAPGSPAAAPSPAPTTPAPAQRTP